MSPLSGWKSSSLPSDTYLDDVGNHTSQRGHGFCHDHHILFLHHGPTYITGLNIAFSVRRCLLRCHGKQGWRYWYMILSGDMMVFANRCGSHDLHSSALDRMHWSECHGGRFSSGLVACKRRRTTVLRVVSEGAYFHPLTGQDHADTSGGRHDWYTNPPERYSVLVVCE